jgi:HPt (histidine-containing phosphotransfer) domain-containing protein
MDEQKRLVPRPTAAPDPDAEIDVEAIQQLIGLAGEAQPELIDELLDLFDSNTREVLPRLRELVAAGGSVEAARLAHSLAGSASTVGAIGFAATARQIEDILRIQSGGSALPLVEGLAAQLDRALTLLRAERRRV